MSKQMRQDFDLQKLKHLLLKTIGMLLSSSCRSARISGTNENLYSTKLEWRSLASIFTSAIPQFDQLL